MRGAECESEGSRVVKSRTAYDTKPNCRVEMSEEANLLDITGAERI